MRISAMTERCWIGTAIPALAVLACLCPSTGCRITIGSLQSQTDTRTRVPPPPPSTEGLSLAAPTVGLFIGVSEYGQRAGVPSTAAHTLSAALLHEPFFVGAMLAVSELRKADLKIPADNYFKAHAKAVCAVAFTPRMGRCL
jgi:hypothetical protein